MTSTLLDGQQLNQNPNRSAAAHDKVSVLFLPVA